jgi:hypothetical protein
VGAPQGGGVVSQQGSERCTEFLSVCFALDKYCFLKRIKLLVVNAILGSVCVNLSQSIQFRSTLLSLPIQGRPTPAQFMCSYRHAQSPHMPYQIVRCL